VVLTQSDVREVRPGLGEERPMVPVRVGVGHKDKSALVLLRPKFKPEAEPNFLKKASQRHEEGKKGMLKPIARGALKSSTS
jgi:hypothetical protein